MRAAFPYMGSIRLVLEPILRTLGADVVRAPEPGRVTLERGARLAPEMMCLPFKVTLGNMLWCVEHGADSLVYVSGAWSCRFGYYGRLQADILRGLGYRFELLELRRDQLLQIAKRVYGLSQGRFSRAVVRALQAFRLGWEKSVTIERAEELVRRVRPYVAEPAECEALLRRVQAEADRMMMPRELAGLRRGLARRFESLARNGRTRALRVKLVGESYCVLEPFVNFEVVRRLGEMGVEVEPFLTAHRWLGFHGARLGRLDLKRAKRAARPYWRCCTGGEDESSLGHLVLAAQQGFDGVIHIHPFACMPSTVVQPAMMRASRDYGIPLLSLSLDEHTAEAGFLTRLEAFVSLLEKRQQKKGLQHG
jgi:predicted nucleotide-binding protein (sugar kinase/HSP70/actin superfamily)